MRKDYEKYIKENIEKGNFDKATIGYKEWKERGKDGSD